MSTCILDRLQIRCEMSSHLPPPLPSVGSTVLVETFAASAASSPAAVLRINNAPSQSSLPSWAVGARFMLRQVAAFSKKVAMQPVTASRHALPVTSVITR